MSRFRIVDIYSGMGCFRIGFEKEGAKSVYAVEFDQWKRKIYGIIFGKEPEADDVKRLEARNIPQSECWCAGFPCQNASIAGEKSGLAGDKTGLFFEVIRLLKELSEEDRPMFLLLENVRNLLSVNKGFDFARILIELDECGYDAQWQVIDSKHFLPQHRERVYICGCLRSKCSCKILPIEIPISKAETNVKQVMQLDSHRVNPNPYRVYSTTGIAPTLTTAGGGGRSPYVITKQGIRKILPIEAMRLQGVDDEITLKLIASGISDTQLYKAAGDAVTVTVVEAIANKMISIWKESNGNA